MDAKKRQEVRAELASQGYSWEYIDSWPPKIDLYRHKPALNEAGEVVNPVGSVAPNLPGHPDYVARKSRIGLLPWPPGPTCRCKACRERNGSEETTSVSLKLVAAVPAEEDLAAVTVVRGRGRPKGKKRATTGLRTRKEK